MSGAKGETKKGRAQKKFESGDGQIFWLQFCILWSALREKTGISSDAFAVYFALWEVKNTRCKVSPGKSIRFTVADISQVLKGRLDEKKILRVLRELEALSLARFSESDIWLIGEDANTQPVSDILEQITDDAIRERAAQMYEQLHGNTRDKAFVVPRALIKLLARCGRQLVRMATLMALMVRTFLVQRGELKGCCLARWIAETFGVDTSRVRGERAKLIKEHIFVELEGIQQRVKNQFGLWLAPHPSLLAGAVDNSDGGASQSATPPPTNSGAEMPKVQRLKTNNSLFERDKKKTSNPATPGKTGVDNSTQKKHKVHEADWQNMQREDLTDTERALTLYEQVVKLGFLGDCQFDKERFFGAINQAIRKAKTNICGYLRAIVETGSWDKVAEMDNDAGRARLKALGDGQGRGEKNQPQRLLSSISGALDEKGQAFGFGRREHPEWRQLKASYSKRPDVPEPAADTEATLSALDKTKPELANIFRRLGQKISGAGRLVFDDAG